MFAAVYRTNGGPEVLSYEEMPDPIANPGQILVRVEAISIEGADVLRRRRTPPRPNPRIEGYTAAGTVVALGAGVDSFAVGDRVVTFGENGSHAELRAVDASFARRLPQNLSMIHAAVALIGFGTAANALFRLGRLKAGETVVIQGAAGGVGVCAVQLAHRAGARVIGTGSTTSSLEQLRRWGLDEALATSEGPVAKRVMSLTGGRGADLLIDTVGGAALQDGVDSLAEGGRAIMVGVNAGGEHKIDAYRLLVTRKSLTGCMFGPILADPDIARLADDVLARVAAGDLATVVDQQFRLADAVEAHRRAEERGRLGRVVMVP
jgi:NADPH2:quinone reductase